MNCCLQKYTTHQFTYFIYCLFQDKIKNPKLSKPNKYIKSYQQNMIEFLEKYFFLIAFKFEVTQISGEAQLIQSHKNMNHMRMQSNHCHLMPH